MKLYSRPLSGSRFVRDFLREDPVALEHVPGTPRELDSYRTKARDVDARFGRQEREGAASSLAGGGAGARARLRAFVEEGGFLVTTGQQPGLFGGPLYGLYKAMTAAALARRLEGALERPVLPVFWVASEDHDWDEVRCVHVLDPGNELHEVGLPPRGRDDPAPPFHRISLGPEFGRTLARFLELHPDTDFTPRWRNLLEEAYAEGGTLPDAFRTVMEALLEEEGVFFIHAHDAELKARSLPLLLRELREHEEREEALGRRAGELEGAGYDLQVPILGGATNLLFETSRGRERLFAAGDGFRARGSGTRFAAEDLEARCEEDPSLLSPNVLLRPVVEAAVLPTVGYVAGPGELAYLPQAAPVFEAHEIAPPVLHPRLAAFIVERKVEKVLEKFGLDLAAAERPHHELAAELARQGVPPGIRDGLGSLRAEVARGARRLAREVKEVDPTLEGPVDAFRRESFGLLDEVEKKVVQSVKRENEIALAQVDKAQRHLFPRGRPQERTLNPFYYLVRYDADFLAALRGKAEEAVLP